MANTRSLSRLKDLLLKGGLIDELQLRSANARMEQWGGRLPAVLVEMGFVDEEQLVEVIGKALKMPVTHLGTVVKDPAALSRLDVKFCEENAVFPVLLKERSLTLAMADPTELGVIDAVSAKANARVTPVLASESEIAAAIARHYRGQHVEPKSYSMRKRVTHEVPVADGGNLPESVFQLDTSPPPKPGGPTGFMAKAPSANTMLDEILGDDPTEATNEGFTEEELVRLDACRLNQEKASTIIRALTELLTEKGHLG
ncbi:MAG: general secretion pathway protein GspE [Myxococcaceae bacterium]|nr:general secretion pathway protein GspE [Myxococcaceae bacterium]